MGIQAIGMTLTLAPFGDATRDSLRGIWGVVMTWVLAHLSAAASNQPSARTMSQRMVGALLIAVSVVLSVRPSP